MFGNQFFPISYAKKGHLTALHLKLVFSAIKSQSMTTNVATIFGLSFYFIELYSNKQRDLLRTDLYG